MIRDKFAKTQNKKQTLSHVKDSGFTIIEVIVCAGIVFMSLIATFAGITFAEKQISKNYHDRQALMIAAGVLDYQNYLHRAKGVFSYAGPDGDEVVMDQRDHKHIRAKIGVDIWSGLSNDDYNLPMKTVTVTVSWREPAQEKKERFVKLLENFYSKAEM